MRYQKIIHIKRPRFRLEEDWGWKEPNGVRIRALHGSACEMLDRVVGTQWKSARIKVSTSEIEDGRRVVINSWTPRTDDVVFYRPPYGRREFSLCVAGLRQIFGTVPGTIWFKVLSRK